MLALRSEIDPRSGKSGDRSEPAIPLVFEIAPSLVDGKHGCLSVVDSSGMTSKT